jgi:hypothetical protein
MNRSLKWISAALMIVLTIVIGARSINGDSVFPESWQANLFAANAGPETLTLTDGETLPLHIGSSVETHRFSLNAGFPYTLRYLTFSVNLQDLLVPSISDWTVYEIYKGDIDYQTKVAQGESYENGLLKLRFFSDRSYGYYGEGEQEFALVTNLIRNGENTNLSLEQANPDGFYRWAWVEGHFEEPWSELIFSQ